MQVRVMTFWICTMAIYFASGVAVGESIDVISFDTSVRTKQGGLFTCIGAKPDKLRDVLVTTGQPSTGAWKLEVSADANAEGVGAYVPLFDRGDASGSRSIDISRSPNLQVRMIGELGSRRLVVELLCGKNVSASANGVQIGNLAGDAVDGNAWKTLNFPTAVDGVATSAVGAIRLTLEGEGPAWIAFESIRFSSEETTWGIRHAAAEKPMRRAMWVWKSREILPDEQWSKRLLAFCKQQKITDVFWQIPTLRLDDGGYWFHYVPEQRRFNASAHKGGIRVHALHGDPQFVWKKNHGRVFDIVDAVAKFNREGADEEKYYGVHMDNEPHVLKEWKQGHDAQQEIIRDYLDLNRALRKRVNAAGMVYGVDIPFWWDSLDGEGNRKYNLDTADGKVPLLESIFGHVENAGIMSYRVRATGENGVVDCCRTELGLGVKTGVEVFASIETSVGPRVEEGITFGVYPREYLVDQLKTLGRVLPHQDGCVGIAIHDYYSFERMLEKR